MLYHLTKLICLEELANFGSGHLETILDNLLHVQTSKQRKKYNKKNPTHTLEMLHHGHPAQLPVIPAQDW